MQGGRPRTRDQSDKLIFGSVPVPGAIGLEAGSQIGSGPPMGGRGSVSQVNSPAFDNAVTWEDANAERAAESAGMSVMVLVFLCVWVQGQLTNSGNRRLTVVPP